MKGMDPAAGTAAEVAAAEDPDRYLFKSVTNFIYSAMKNNKLKL